MARPLRLAIEDGWFHVVARGTQRRRIFLSDRDCGHFLELLGGMVGRYAIRLHAFVLMDNHYHLLLQTPHANLSRAMQWLNGSYGVWFNRVNESVGPLFQGRFKSVPVEGDGSWALEASVYLHLNPVRVKALGLSKDERVAERFGIAPTLSAEEVHARLERLRKHPWSSYGAYAGYRSRPGWLTCGVLWRRVRENGMKDSDAYRRMVENIILEGAEQGFANRIKGTLAMGSRAFLEKLRSGVRGDPRAQPAVRAWRRLMPFGRVQDAVAAEKGERWESFCDTQGDWGRDVAFMLGRRHCGLTLGELGRAAGGASPAAVGAAVMRMEARIGRNRSLREIVHRIERRLLDVET